ncbi:Oidioi.mRNA.OKI2018_I69.chr2.g7163.t1.cds [Oikopleura dioica]|uniref:Vesicle transport protein USE1 n=1 Tax=Oikopleura dioica TaxID=34765 RepID=A0ABN7T8U1_OIKDI|nr:Oidioi.mRNA.OKI2018_I69.chr2.g7163.t1.cds [Oikopleura dioica]
MQVQTPREVINLKRFLHRTEHFVKTNVSYIHPDTLRFYLKSLRERLENIKKLELVTSDECVSYNMRIVACEQYLKSKTDEGDSLMKISRVSDLEARQLLLRGHAQREARQRESLLTKKPPKIQDKQLTLRQRRILLLENDENRGKSASYGSGEDSADANALATETLELTRMLKEQARNTKDIVGEDNKLLGEMDASMDNNIENLRKATQSIEGRDRKKLCPKVLTIKSEISKCCNYKIS